MVIFNSFVSLPEGKCGGIMNYALIFSDHFWCDQRVWLTMGYPLVNVYKKLWKTHPFFMGKSTISMAMFNSFLYVYQRVYPPNGHDQIRDPRFSPSGALAIWPWPGRLAMRFRFMRRKTEDLKDASSQVFCDWGSVVSFDWKEQW